MLLPLLTASLALAAEGSGRGTIVWMQPDLPSEEDRKKAEKVIGYAAVHAAWSDIAFPAAPFGKEDEARLAAVDRARADAKQKWEEFDAEKEIAAGLGTALSKIDVLRDESDRKMVTGALLLQGAAALRIVPESDFATAEAVATYRVFVGSTALVRPYAEALALEPEGVWTREDVQDNSALTRLGADREAAGAQARAKLDLAALPAGVSLVVDGRPVPAGTTSLELPPGRHYVHALVGGQIAGRRVLDVAAGAAQSFEPVVSRGELDEARARVLEGSKDVPPDVAAGIPAVATRNGLLTPTFLATLDDKGRVEVLPYTGGAAFVKKSPVAVLLAGSVGGTFLESSAFVDTKGTPTTALGVGGNLGAEVGIYNLAVYGGTSLLLTPGAQMRYRAPDDSSDIDTNAYFLPYGGLGVYLPRPDQKKFLALIGAHYGWMSPGANGFGARVSIGIPAGDGTWFRVDLDGMRTTQLPGFHAEGTPNLYAGLRVGFARKL